MFVKKIKYLITSLGPGNRVVIYTTRCNKRCKGCMSEGLQTIDKSSYMSVSDILNYIKEWYKENKNIGITISVGEPFLQIDLYELVKYIFMVFFLKGWKKN